MQDVCTDQEMNQILERARRRDLAALDRLYVLYVDKMYRYIWLRVGDQALAEDLVMDVFVRLVEHIADFRIPAEQQVAAFSAWLFRVASNRIKDHYRRQQRSDRYMTREMVWRAAGNSDDPAQLDIDRLATQDQLRQALETLSDSQQQVLYLRFVQDLTSAQTAQVMKKSEGAVKILQHRALHNLRRALGLATKGTQE